jgi:hypothetical protein
MSVRPKEVAGRSHGGHWFIHSQFDRRCKGVNEGVLHFVFRINAAASPRVPGRKRFKLSVERRRAARRIARPVDVGPDEL